ncbi:MAG: c-type cytochrome domain-containing protein [Planctomycetota bacterium]
MSAPSPSHRVRAWWSVAVLPSVVLLALAAGRPADATDDAAPPTWADVRVVFERACVKCHRAGRALGGLALDTWPALRRGVAGRGVLVAGHPEKGSLTARIRGRAKPAMPTDGQPLPEADLRTIERWIEAGAEGPAVAAARGTEPVAAASAPPAATPTPGAADAGAPPTPSGAGTPPPVADGAPLRWRDVAPILAAQCVRCHEGEASCAPGGLRYDTYAATIEGGTCVSVVPGRPEASALVASMKEDAVERMPADGPPYACAETIARLSRWIADGARDDDGRPAPTPVGRPLCVVGHWDGASHVGAVEVVVDATSTVPTCLRAGATTVAHLVVGRDGALHVTRLEAPAAAATPPK